MRKWIGVAVVTAVVAAIGLVAVVGAADGLPRRGTIKPLLLAGTGTQTSSGTPGCQFNPGYCDVAFEGTAQFGPITGLPAGPWNWTSTLRVFWNKATDNGNGGYCAPAVGEFQVTHTRYGSFTAQQAGTVCEVGTTGSNVHTFEGNFTIISSSGMKLAGVQGGGAVSAYKDASGNTTNGLSGVQFKTP